MMSTHPPHYDNMSRPYLELQQEFASFQCKIVVFQGQFSIISALLIEILKHNGISIAIPSHYFVTSPQPI